MWQLSTCNLHCIYNYLHSIYIVLSVVLMAKNTHMKNLRETILTHWTKSSMAEVFQEWECAINQFSGSVVSDSLRPHELQHARPPCPSPTPGVHPNPCPLSRWCHPTISSSVIFFTQSFSSCPQSFPASGNEKFKMSHFFASGGQSIGVSASALVLPMNTQDWWSIRLGRNQSHLSVPWTYQASYSLLQNSTWLSLSHFIVAYAQMLLNQRGLP